MNERARKPVLLAQGEIDLIRRALRYYIHAEREAAQTAACARDPEHARDVARQVRTRIEASEALLEHLLQSVLPPCIRR